MMARMAATQKASVPGRTARWKSASSAVLVRRGSITTMARSGSLEMARRVRRASGKPWLCQGFLPRNTATSVFSMSERVWARYRRASTKASPVFSWAMALDRYWAPSRLVTAVP